SNTEKTGWLRKPLSEPVALTNGPLRYFGHVFAADRKTIFVMSSQSHGELVRYDSNSRNFSPYLSGFSAEGVSFSRDEGWMAYTSSPLGELWRSRPNGIEALQLTRRPLFAFGASWSPDGRQIAFSGKKAGGEWQLYVVAANGGTPLPLPEAKVLPDVSWSP